MATPINRYQNMISVPSGTMQTQVQNQQIISTGGSGLKQIGEAVGNYANVKMKEELSREEANQTLWLSTRRSADKLAAKRILEAAKQTAQAGGKISETIENEWSRYTAKQKESLKENPYLAELYDAELIAIKSAIDMDAQDWEFQEQTRYTGQIFEENLQAKLAAYDDISDIGKINAQNQKDMLELNSLLDATALDPAEKESLREKIKKDIPNAVMNLAIARDPYFTREAINAKGGFDTAFTSILREEGKDFVSNDGGAGPTMLGINKEANPDISLEDLKKLTPEKAKKLYKERYWDEINADSLPPDIAHVAMDIAVVQGQPTAKRLLKEAGGDLQKLVELREERFKQSAKNPEKAKFLDGWLERSKRIAGEASAIGGISAYRMGTLEQKMDWREKAEREIAAREQAANRQIKIGQSYINTIEDRLNSGYNIPEQEMMMVQQQIASVNQPELWQKWEETLTKVEAQRSYKQLSPTKLQEYIANVLMPAANKDGATNIEMAKLQAAQNILSNTSKLAQSDTLALYETQGVPIPPIDLSSPDAFSNRIQLAQAAAADYEVPFSTAYLRPNEKTQIENYLQTQPANKQVALMNNMVSQLGPATPAVASLFDKTAPGFSYAASMLASDPSRSGIAKAIIEGKQILKEDSSLAPENAEVDSVMQAWQGYIGNPAQYSAARDAAVAIYVARNGAMPFDEGKMREAIEDAVGGQRATINGQNTISPIGVSPEKFEAWVNTVSVERLNELMNFMPQYLDEQGRPKAPFNTKEDRLRLVAIGANTYQLYNSAGKKLAGKSTEDGAAIITLSKGDIEKDAQMIDDREKQIRQRNAQNQGAIIMRAGF